MGIYDRDYYQREPAGVYLRVPSVVTILIALNVTLWLINSLLSPQGMPGFGVLGEWLAASSRTLPRPWFWWQFLTYGFVHAQELQHVLFNMLGLFFFGREIERLYGPKEFLRIYLAAIVAGGVAWGLIAWLTGVHGVLGGASGAVTAVVILFALNYPRQMVLFMFFIPMPAWVLGLILVGLDLYGAVVTPQTNVAYVVHLTGAAFALAYFRLHWNFGNLGWSSLVPSRWRARPKLQVHDPYATQTRLNEEVDRILEKISREGEESLTRKERRTLEDASRQYQKRRQRGA